MIIPNIENLMTIPNLYFPITGYLQHAISLNVHFFDGTHKLDDPVSKTTLNFWGGVPMPITP